MTSRDLTLRCLRGDPTPHPPVVCPGGMMSFAVTEVMEQTGCWWPEAHTDAKAMATLAVAMAQTTGFDNVAVPFCMTVEAEALGATVNLGDSQVQPRILHEPLLEGDRATQPALAVEAAFQRAQLPSARDRRPVVLEALRLARAQAPDLALIGSLVGPVSLAGQLLEASLLLRALRREPDSVHRLLDYVTGFLEGFAVEQVKAGADVLMVADPTATGEILGPDRYREFAEPYLARLIDTLHAAGAPVLLHICGNPHTILPALAETKAEAVSLDELANLREAREVLTRQRLMGNLSARLLEAGPPEVILLASRKALGWGADILAPACGVLAGTPTRHLQAMAAASLLGAQ